MSGTALVIIAIGLAVTSLAIVYGMINARHRTRGEERARERATDRLYKTEPK